MLSYICCYFCLLIGGHILGAANAFMYILLLLFTDWYAYTLVRQMLSYIYCYFCLQIGTRILGTANAFIYILLLLFTYWWAYTWYGRCFHIYTATFVYRFVRVNLGRQMLSYIYCYFCLLTGARILSTANAFIYIQLRLITDWYAYIWCCKCFHIYTATSVCWLARVYSVRHMLSYIYCNFCLLIGARILGTANASIYILLLLFTDWCGLYLVQQNAFIYILLLLFTYWWAYTWCGNCFHISTATFVYWLVRVYLLWQMLPYIYCYFCLLIDSRILSTAKCFHIYTATFVYLLVGIYLARQMLSCIYCYFCLQIGTRTLGTANAFIYILLLLFTDWYAYTWYGKCFHIYTATFVYWLVRVYLVRQMLSYIYSYFCLLIRRRILGTANAFIYILLLLFTDWCAYT